MYSSDDPIRKEPSAAPDVMIDPEPQIEIPECSCSNCPAVAMLSRCCKQMEKSSKLCEGIYSCYF